MNLKLFPLLLILFACFGVVEAAWCFQNQTNVSQSCGSFNTSIGSYDVGDFANWSGNTPWWIIDNNEATGDYAVSSQNGTIFVNWTKPYSAVSGKLWFIVDMPVGIANYTINESCFNALPDKVQLVYRSIGDLGQNESLGCLNSSYDGTLNGYVTMHYRSGYKTLYEDGLWWELGSGNVQISIRYEENNSLILQNVTLRFSNNITEIINITYTGEFIALLDQGNYSVTASSQGFSPRSYDIEVGNMTSNLNIYLSNSSTTTIFTVTDADSGVVIPEVGISMFRMVNGSWVTVDTQSTDVTGKAQFYYVPSVDYKFYLTKSGYEDYIFYLTPILFSEYDVTLRKSNVANFSQDFQGVSVGYAPRRFRNGTAEVFDFVIAAPSGNLVSYGYNITYLDASGVRFSDVQSGSNVLGGQLSSSFTPYQPSIFDGVIFYYHYTTTLGGQRNFTDFLSFYPSDSLVNGTIGQLRNKTYGMTLFERVLILTMILIFVAGLGAMFGQPVGGFALAMLVGGILVRAGFVPFWMFAVPLFAGVLIIIYRSGQ